MQTRRLSAVLDFANEADLLAAVIDGGAVALAAKRFDAATRQQVGTAYLASVVAHRYGDAVKIGGVDPAHKGVFY